MTCHVNQRESHLIQAEVELRIEPYLLILLVVKLHWIRFEVSHFDLLHLCFPLYKSLNSIRNCSLHYSFRSRVIKEAHTWIALIGFIVNSSGVGWDSSISCGDIKKFKSKRMNRSLTPLPCTSHQKQRRLTSHARQNNVKWEANKIIISVDASHFSLVRSAQNKETRHSSNQMGNSLLVWSRQHISLLVWNKWEWTGVGYFSCLILLHSWETSTHTEWVAICMQGETH